MNFHDSKLSIHECVNADTILIQSLSVNTAMSLKEKRHLII